MRRTAIVIVVLLLAVVFSSCDQGGGAIFVGGSASAMIGPAGGQITSADGRLTLDIPAGALATTENITITDLPPSGASPGLAGLQPDAVWELSPDGLVFAQPVAVTIDLGPAPPVSGGNVTYELPAVVTDSAATGPDMLDVDEIEVVPGGSVTATGELTHFSQVAIQVSQSLGVAVTVVHPTSLPGPNVAGPVDATIDVMAQNRLGTQGMVTWFAATGLQFDTAGITPGEAFGDTTFPVLGPSLVQDEFDLFCEDGPGGEWAIVVTFPVMTVVLDLLTALANSINEVEDDEDGFSVVLRLATSCGSTMGGSGIQQPTFVSMLGMVTDVEGMNLVPQGSGCSDPMSPRVTVAGADPAGGATAVIVDPVGGAIVQGFGLFDLTGNAFDAPIIQSPTPGVGEALAVCGTTGYTNDFNGPCQLAPGLSISMGFHEDTAYVAQDPRKGTVSAVGASIVMREVDDQTGFAALASTVLSNVIRSVSTNESKDRHLVIMNPAQLVHVNEGPESAGPSETVVAVLGSNPRRIRWDPTSGLGGITDFTDDTVTVFTWDGTNLPVILGTANVGDGPVGLDVMGNRIVCAGFDDDTYSLIEVDLAGGTITSVTTVPIPFPGGPLQPGHAIFMRDANDSIGLSFFGADAVGFLPFVF